MNIFNKIITANDIKKKTIMRHDIKMLLGKNNIIFYWNYVYRKFQRIPVSLIDGWALVYLLAEKWPQNVNNIIYHSHITTAAACSQRLATNGTRFARTYIYANGCTYAYYILLFYVYINVCILEKRRPIQIFFWVDKIVTPNFFNN